MKNETLRKLKEMRLPAFAEQYEKQIENEIEYQSLSFHERLALLVESESASRHTNNVNRLIHKASFSIPAAYMKNIKYLPDRHLNRDLLESLSDNEYIRQALNVILTGATGSGKTYISNALGVNACQHGYHTKYIRLPAFFSQLEAARVQGKYAQFMKQYSKYSLLILDEFLLVETVASQRNELLELIEKRSGIVSTIFCSHYKPAYWHELLGAGALAESILDRLTTSAYEMHIEGDISMRQRKKEL